MKSRILAFILSVLMIASTLPAAALAADGGLSDGWYPVEFTKEDDAQSALPLNEANVQADEEQYGEHENLRVSIVLEGSPTLEKYTQSRLGTKAARNYRAMLMRVQDLAARRISKEALGGKELDVVWNLTLSANLISANVEYGQIDSIKEVSGVRDVIIEKASSPCVVIDDDTADVQMVTGAGITGTYDVWSEGYTGVGTAVAVIDTGLDVDHRSFDEGAFEYALSTVEKDYDLVTREDIEAVLGQLNIKTKVPELTADDLYLNSKIPFAYNYVDMNSDVSHLNDRQGNHGTHVAGIAAANRYVPDGNGGYADAQNTVSVCGQAPDAQLLVMKVFGANGGAYESDYMAAIEDSIVLGAASANLSLGSDDPGFSNSFAYEDIMNRLTECDTVVAVAANNASNRAYGLKRSKLYAEDKQFNTVGNPASFYNSLAVASSDNAGWMSSYLTFFGEKMTYSENVLYGQLPISTLNGEHEFIMIDSFGTEEEFAAVSDVLEGKIAICLRGDISFSEKANAAVENGAIAVFIINNDSAMITMALTNYGYKYPAILVDMAARAIIMENADAVTDPETGDVLYYTGTVAIPEGRTYMAPETGFAMSYFSSWGIPDSLILKPEITAPGGNIFSVYGECLDYDGILTNEGNDKYGYKSGTSMATPQIAGISALIREYIDENGLAEKTGMSRRQLTTALLMGCAVPMYDKENGGYYPVMAQGAGLANADSCFDTHTYLTMHADATDAYADGKVKAEIGEVSRDEKSFDFTFDVNNFGAEDAEYCLGTEFFTQRYVEDATYGMDGGIVFDENNKIKMRLFTSLATDPLAADVVWTVNGETLYSDETELYDFNADGAFSYSDVQALLDYIVGNLDTLNLIENADVDGDGDVDTYDAYIFLDMTQSAALTVPANGKATVNVSVKLLDIDDYDISGAYVEGFVFVDEADGVSQSIPVIGYYGRWDDFRMFDYGMATDDMVDPDAVTPYMWKDDGALSLISTSFTVMNAKQMEYTAFGNPYVRDDVYIPERNSIAKGATLLNSTFTLIRNSAATGVVVTDEDGDELYRRDFGAYSAVYYDDYDEKWYGTIDRATVDFRTDELEDGDVFTATLRTAPEYYAPDGADPDWDSLSDMTRFSQTFTVDAYAPELLSVEAHYNEEAGCFDAIRVEAKDERYLSCAALLDESDNMINYYGSDPDVGAAPGKTLEYVFDLAEIYGDPSDAPTHYKVVVADYACNETSYKLNLNEEELSGDLWVEISPEDVTIPLGGNFTFTAKVCPWGKSGDIVWSSTDETVATVGEDGTACAVGEGETVIRAALADDPDNYAEAAVSVVKISKSLDAVVWDNDAIKWFSSFDTDTLPDYTKKTEKSYNDSIMSVFYDRDGTLYAVTNRNGSSDVYTVDEDTYDISYVSTLEFSSTSSAAAPAMSASKGEAVFLGVYYTYVTWNSIETGECPGAFDFSEYTGNVDLIGVAYAGSYYNEESMAPLDVYYVLDINGILYKAAFGESEEEGFIMDDVETLGKIGKKVETDIYQSLYVDVEGSLLWSRTSTDEDICEIIYCDPSADGIFGARLGVFENGVWPAAGLYEEGKALVFDYENMIAHDETGGTEGAAKSGVHPASVKDATPKSAEEVPDIQSYAPDRTIVRIVADGEQSNGLYTVTFDPSVYEFSELYCEAVCYAMNCEDGVVTLAFADTIGYDQDDVIADVLLKRVSDGERAVAVATEEVNEEHPGTVEYLYKVLDLQLVPSARLASYEIDNENRVINVVTKKDQPLAVFQLKLAGTPQTAFTLTDGSFGEQAMQIKNVKYYEPTDAAGIRYFVSSVTNGYEQKYEIAVTDTDGAEIIYKVNVYFDHSPAVCGIVPGYNADPVLTGFDPDDDGVIDLVSKPGYQSVTFNLKLAPGSELYITSVNMPHVYQTNDGGVTYEEVHPYDINQNAIVYMRVDRSDGIDSFDFAILDRYGGEEYYSVVVTFVDP